MPVIIACLQYNQILVKIQINLIVINLRNFVFDWIIRASLRWKALENLIIFLF